MDTAIKEIPGGVTAPAGFRASGIHAGLRKNKSRRDLALIVADCRCAAAGVFTTNKVYAAPVGVTREHIADGYAQAIICNSGNANACTVDGFEKANLTCKALSEHLGIKEEDIIVASTGVIGLPLPVEIIISAIPELAEQLAYGEMASYAAANAIMTTDTRPKEFACEFTLGGKKVKIGAICKGSGMIEPNIATMLGFITTDAVIEPAPLREALRSVVADTFNMVSVDGDTSTNDMVIILASGMANNAAITAPEGEDYETFRAALLQICTNMAKAIAADGEGATKLLECTVRNYYDKEGAKKLAKSVIKSPLVKTAMFGADANWGRIICALGYAGVEFDPYKVDLKFKSKAGEIDVCKNGCAIEVDEEKAKEILSCDYIYIDVDCKCGKASATAWGCDLSYEYVRINGDYRS